jgi:hypothetical protein
MKAPVFLQDKKGFIYLLLTSVFIAVMVVVFLSYQEYKYTDRQQVINTRIMTIDDFIKSIDADSKNAIYISGFRALIALEDHVAGSGQYISDPEETFRIAFYNGSVNGSQVEILENASYVDYLAKLKVIANRVGVDIDINVTNITLYHTSPWTVDVVVATHINLSDQKRLAKWAFDKNYNTSVSIVNIRDPVYSVATHGKIPKPIRFNDSLIDFVDGGTNDTTNLLLHINNSFYIQNTLAPSFLMRLQGNFSPSEYGIESLVNLVELDIQGVNYSNSKSIVDYILFSNIQGYSQVACWQNISEGAVLPWFKIDQNHTRWPEDNIGNDKYELNRTLAPTTCPVY